MSSPETHLPDSPSSSSRPRIPAFPRPLHGLIRSFHYAFSGLSYLFRTQRNARIHLAIGAAACCIGGWVGLSRVEWAVIIFTIALVLILEGLNTAVEAAIDLASPQFHLLAKAAKDLSAGMVLIAAIASVGVGLLILGPPLWGKLFH